MIESEQVVPFQARGAAAVLVGDTRSMNVEYVRLAACQRVRKHVNT